MLRNSFCRGIGMGRPLSISSLRTLPSSVRQAALILNPSPLARISRFHLLKRFRDGQDLIAFEVVGIFAHPVLLVILWILLLYLLWRWWRIFGLRFLPWRNMAPWFRRKWWPVWANKTRYLGFLCFLSFFRLLREGLLFWFVSLWFWWNIVARRAGGFWNMRRRRRTLHDCKKLQSGGST